MYFYNGTYFEATWRDYRENQRTFIHVWGLFGRWFGSWLWDKCHLYFMDEFLKQMYDFLATFGCSELESWAGDLVGTRLLSVAPWGEHRQLFSALQLTTW